MKNEKDFYIQVLNRKFEKEINFDSFEEYEEYFDSLPLYKIILGDCYVF